MSVTFTKLFSSLPESTIWCEPSDTRVMWVTLLAMADSKGRVFGSIPGMANRAQIPIESCIKAFDCFMSPDPHSRTKDEEGRRVAVIDGGWRLVNYNKYRETKDAEREKERKRNWATNSRAKQAVARYSVVKGGGEAA